MEQKESLRRAENALRGITMCTHKHCLSYRVRIRMKGGQYFDRSFKSKTLAKNTSEHIAIVPSVVCEGRDCVPLRYFLPVFCARVRKFV